MNINYYSNCFAVNGPGPAPNAAQGGSPRPLNHLKQHLLHKSGYGNQSPTSPQSFVNGPGMHQPMGPPQMQAPPRMQVRFNAIAILLF